MNGGRSRYRVWEPALVGLILIAGIGLRLLPLRQPLMDYQAWRQYYAAEMARKMLVTLRPELGATLGPLTERRALELPVFEVCVLPHALLTGDVSLAAGRVVAILFWTAGAVFFFFTFRQLHGRGAAGCALAVLMLWPFGIRASRVWLPEPVAVGFAGAAAWACLRALATGRARWWWATALAAALVVTVKPTVAFLCGPLLLALILFERRPGAWRAMRVAGLVGLALIALWYGSGFASGRMAGQIESKVNLALLGHRIFYECVVRMLKMTLGFWPLLATAVACAVAGITLRERAWLLGGALGLGAMLVIFSQKVVNHDYYYLAMLPWVAAGCGVLAQAAGRRLLEERWRGVVAAGALLLLTLHAVRSVQVQPDDAQAWHDATQRMEAVGRIVGHSDKVVSAGSGYCLPLYFHGRMNGLSITDRGLAAALEQLYWHRVPAQVEEFEQARSALAARFFVSAELEETCLTPELARHLQAHYRRIPSPEGTLVYDLSAEASP
jgi:hypothetical protein